MIARPPKWIIKVLTAICPDHLQDEIEGDFFEHYSYLYSRKGSSYANRKSIGFLLLSAPRLISKRKYYNSINLDMLRNYVIVAFRNLKRQLGYSLINIFGLAVGLACCLLIGIYVLHELSFDKFHTDADSLFRVNIAYESSGISGKGYTTPTALLPSLKREFNEVEAGTRVYNIAMFSPVIVEYDDNKFQEEQFMFADSTFFDVFSFQLLIGNPNSALTKPRSVLLTESSVEKYFGDEDPSGKSIKVDGRDYLITGIMKDIPDNSHLQFDFLASFTSIRASQSEIWGSANYATYVKMRSGASIDKIEEAAAAAAMKQLGEYLGDTKITFDFMKLTDIHLRSDIPDEMQPQNDIKYIYVLSLVGLLILVIACINYMNLSTARSMERAREVGMRKVLGAVRRQVFYQFIGESTIITCLSLVIALVIVNISLPTFNQLTAKQLVVSDIFSGELVIGIIGIFLLVSFLAGAYPALTLSSFDPGSVLKGSFKRSKSGNLVRRILVVIQFGISIFLIIGTLVIYKQLSFMRDKKLGYNNENVLIIPTDNEVNDKFERIRTVLESRSDVSGVSIASESPTEINGGYTIEIPGLTDDPVSLNAVTVDRDFVKNMGMRLISGRHFTDADVESSTKGKREDRFYGFIVNQELLRTVFSNEEDIIGMRAELNGRVGEIIGVVEDFHFTSLHRKINPLILMVEPSQYNKLFIRIKPENIQQTLISLEDDWKEIIGGRPFIFEFMDDEYDSLYNQEMRLSRVFTFFAILAVVIACLGLFGLVSFAVEQRNKEIGVRKVLGATVPGLFLLVSKDFSKLVLIAFFVSAPLSYWLLNNWLGDFEYRTDVGILPIILAIVLSMAVALLTVSYQSIKAAQRNPADTLRSE